MSDYPNLGALLGPSFGASGDVLPQQAPAARPPPVYGPPLPAGDVPMPGTVPGPQHEPFPWMSLVMVVGAAVGIGLLVAEHNGVFTKNGPDEDDDEDDDDEDFDDEDFDDEDEDDEDEQDVFGDSASALMELSPTMAFPARNQRYRRMRARGALGADSEWVPDEIAQAMAEDDVGDSGMFSNVDNPDLHLDMGIFEDSQSLPGYALRERGDGPSEVIDAQTGTRTRVFLPGYRDGQVNMPSTAPRYPIAEGYMLRDPRSLFSEDSGVGVDPIFDASLTANDVPSLGDIPAVPRRTDRYLVGPEQGVTAISTRYRDAQNAGRGGSIGYEDIYLPGQGVVPVSGLGADPPPAPVDTGDTPLWQYVAAGVLLGVAVAVVMEMRGH